MCFTMHVFSVYKLMIEVNTGKMERAIEEAALYTENGEYISGAQTEVREEICV